jgi:hypothetical protein
MNGVSRADRDAILGISYSLKPEVVGI